MYRITHDILKSLSSIYFSLAVEESLPGYEDMMSKRNAEVEQIALLSLKILKILNISVDSHLKALIYNDRYYFYDPNFTPKIDYILLTPFDIMCLEEILNHSPYIAAKTNALFNCIGYVVHSSNKKDWKLKFMGAVFKDF